MGEVQLVEGVVVGVAVDEPGEHRGAGGELHPALGVDGPDLHQPVADARCQGGDQRPDDRALAGPCRTDDQQVRAQQPDTMNQTVLPYRHRQRGQVQLAGRETKPIVYETYHKSLLAAIGREEGLALEIACRVCSGVIDAVGDPDTWIELGNSDDKEELASATLSHMVHNESHWKWANIWRYYNKYLSFDALYELEGHGATILPTPIIGSSEYYIAPGFLAASAMANRHCNSGDRWPVDEIGAIVTLGARWILSIPPQRSPEHLPLMFANDSDVEDQHREYTELELLSGLVILAAASEESDVSNSVRFKMNTRGHFESFHEMASHRLAPNPSDGDDAMMLRGRLLRWSLDEEFYCSSERVVREEQEE